MSLLEDGEGEVEERVGREVMVEDGGSCSWFPRATLEAMGTMETLGDPCHSLPSRRD
jgi:hypothetical protein